MFSRTLRAKLISYIHAKLSKGRGLSHSGIGDEVKVGGGEWVCAEVLQGDFAAAWVEGGVVVAWIEGGIVVAWAAARIRVEVEVGGGAKVLEGGVVVAWVESGVVVAWAAARDRVEVEVEMGSCAEVLQDDVAVTRAATRIRVESSFFWLAPEGRFLASPRGAMLRYKQKYRARQVSYAASPW